MSRNVFSHLKYDDFIILYLRLLFAAHVCVCYAVSQTGISFNVLKTKIFLDYKDFFWMERPEPGVLEDFVPLDRRSVRNRSLEQVVKKSCSTSDVDSWPVSPEKTRDCCEIHGVALQKNVFGMNSCQLFMRLLCCCCCCSSDRFESRDSSVVKVLSQLFVENLYSVCTGPWFVTATANFSSKNKDILKKIRNNNMWPYSTDLWFSSHQWYLKLGAETP